MVSFTSCSSQKRLRDLRCRRSDASSHHSDITRDCIYPPREFHCSYPVPQNATSDGCLSLLKTCRQLYIESTTILYETNTFDINHAATLLFLHRTILPVRLQSIRYIQISWRGDTYHFSYNRCELYQRWNYPDDFGTWNRMWGIVGGEMKGLRSLKLRLWSKHLRREMTRKEGVEKIVDGSKTRVRG